MSANEPGKWKRFKQGMKKVGDVISDGGKAIKKWYGDNSDIIGGIGRGVRNLGLQAVRGTGRLLGKADALAKKLDSYADGQEMPGFGSAMAKAGSALLQGTSYLGNAVARGTNRIYKQVKAGDTIIDFEFFSKDCPVYRRYAEFDKNKIVLMYDTPYKSKLIITPTPAVKNSKSLSFYDIEGPNGEMIGPAGVTIHHRLSQFKLSTTGLRFADVTSIYEEDKQCSVINVSFQNEPDMFTEIYIPKNRVTVSLNKKARKEHPEYIITLRRVSKYS